MHRPDATDQRPAAQTAPFLLVSGDFVRTGGMDLGNFHLARYLAQRGEAVHLVSHRVDPALSAHANVVFHQASRPYGSHLVGERMLRRLGQQVARHLAATTRVHCVVNGGNCPLPGANWVHYVHAASSAHGGSSPWRRWKSRLSRWLFLRDEAHALRRARVVIVNSDRTRRDLIRHYRLPAERIHLVYYGTDPALFYPVDDAGKRALRGTLGLPLDKRLFVFVGALGDRRKGFDTLFAAWQTVGQEFRDSAELIVVGRGAELPVWQQRATKSPSHGSIRFLGFRQDVPDILRASDALVAPTRYEAFGLAVQEALCCGLPAIVSRDAGVSECLPPGLGDLLLHDPESVPELTGKLLLLHRRHAEILTRTKCLSDKLRANTWEEMSRTIYTLLVQKS